MKILSIETSCDETAISIIKAELATQLGERKPVFEVLGNAIYSQAETHAEYGGVFPSLAKREHARNFVPLLVSALKGADMLIDKSDEDKNNDDTSNSDISFLQAKESLLLNDLEDFFLKFKTPDIDLIAVTVGPGLEPALWVGINGAKALALTWQKPIVPVNHMEGHIASILLNNSESPEFPAIALLISGGHTELVEIDDWGKYKIIGQTRDDAVGEAFDKVARVIGLKYPGGPKISMLAKKHRERTSGTENMETNAINDASNDATTAIKWNLPRPVIDSPDYSFSFSGLKTSVINAVSKAVTKAVTNTTSSGAQETGELNEEDKASLCAEFEQAVTDVLIKKSFKAIDEYEAKSLIIGGGVSANAYIRESFEKYRDNNCPELKLIFPTKTLSTDNSIMIGLAGYLEYLAGKQIDAEDTATIEALKAEGNLKLS